MVFASPIEALLQGYASADCFHRQQQFLVEPLSTRQKELLVKPMERILSQVSIKIVWLMGIPPLVCPPPPSDTPPPVFVSFNSIKTSAILNHELQKTRETTRKYTTISISSWVFSKLITLTTNPKRLSSTATQKSNLPSQTKLIRSIKISLSRGKCIRQGTDETTIDDSVSLLSPIRLFYAAIILNERTTTLTMITCDCDLCGTSIDGDIINIYRCIKFAPTRSDTSSTHGLTPRGTGGIIENKSKESKGTKVSIGGVIIEGTKALYCQCDKAENISDNVLPKVCLERGEVYLLRLLNKCFKFLSICLALGSFNSINCVGFPFMFMNKLDLGLVFPFLFFPFTLLNKYVRSSKDTSGNASHQQHELHMQNSHQQQLNTEGEGGRHTPLHNSDSYQPNNHSATQPPATSWDHFNVQIMKYPSKIRLFLWIVIEEGVKTFTLRIYHHHYNNKHRASYICYVLHQLCDEITQLTGIKTGLRSRRNIDAIKGIKNQRTSRSEVNAYNWELVTQMFFFYPIVKTRNTTFLNYVNLD